MISHFDGSNNIFADCRLPEKDFICSPMWRHKECSSIPDPPYIIPLNRHHYYKECFTIPHPPFIIPLNRHHYYKECFTIPNPPYIIRKLSRFWGYYPKIPFLMLHPFQGLGLLFYVNKMIIWWCFLKAESVVISLKLEGTGISIVSTDW